ncbi:PIG-L deacetylase family protein [Lignipirellula cremea]|uniref:1D-myo-inositol 2-acetamido-2-deoxy-alpha-D-glucopyranoside deacetylase n=1 Tax=Lignipirellula cremea TaxID=2528010 RepID=A0A518DQT3_9BACT|nr:PIG-L family deacetylase [Lignipirellula cremea]QDU94198.1 1D-myo-inositol 2-acetamido-2-deoxy-alpha-D-glucopyranoside deacetylase [Lignipirellula cremea]
MKSVLAIAAHPDDIEFFMAGTLMRLREAGYQVHYMNLANGHTGSTEYSAEETARVRREEARAAAAHLEAVFYPPICSDLAIFYERDLLAKVAAVVRQAAPQIVLTHSPDDYMEDHMNACRLAVTAAFSRNMPNFVTDPRLPAILAPTTVYHAQPYSHRDPLRRRVFPDLYVDVSDLIEQKVAMLAEHKSQKRWLDESQGHDSYLQAMRDLDAELGRQSTLFQYAEGWRRHLHLGFCGPDDDPLFTALGEKAFARPLEEGTGA